MIIIKVQGGLGNQLFQYSFGQLLSVVHNKEVAYDLSFFKESHPYTKRAYLLDQLGFTLREAALEEIKKTKYPYGGVSFLIWWFKKIVNKFFIKKYHIAYEEGFVDEIAKNDSKYLEGYFQSYQYVMPVLEKLQKELHYSGGDIYREFSKKIVESNSVFVHVRRGDYFTGGKNLGVVDISYYKKAAAYINAHVVSPRYYIFSDDILWVKDTMWKIFPDAVYVPDGEISDVEEIVYMTHAHHGIIANSTFSWWGAMLMKGKVDKKSIIVCPEHWNNIYIQTKDICPPEWVRV